MASTGSLTVSMSARAVEAARAPFVPRDGVYHDAGVALDEILSLTGNVEPVVLRVSCSGGSAEQRASIEGDWLCVDHEEPALLPRPAMGWPDEAKAWCAGREWIDAWELCDRADWMMEAAGDCSLDAAIFVAAACACARTSLPFVPDGGKYRHTHSEYLSGPRLAIEAAESWARGRSDGETARRASWGADFIANEFVSHRTFERSAISYAARSASAAAMAAYFADAERTNRGGATAARYAAESYASAVHASSDPRASHETYAAAYRRRLAELSSLVRETVPTVAVLRGVAFAPAA